MHFYVRASRVSIHVCVLNSNHVPLGNWPAAGKSQRPFAYWKSLRLLDTIALSGL